MLYIITEYSQTLLKVLECLEVVSEATENIPENFRTISNAVHRSKICSNRRGYLLVGAYEAGSVVSFDINFL